MCVRANATSARLPPFATAAWRRTGRRTSSLAKDGRPVSRSLGQSGSGRKCGTASRTFRCRRRRGRDSGRSGERNKEKCAYLLWRDKTWKDEDPCARACTIKLDGHSSHPDESKHIFQGTASDHKSCYVNICINLNEVLSAAHPHAAFPPRFKPVKTWGRTTEATAAK